MSFNPRELYLARKKENFDTFTPYMRYVGQSGLLLVIAFLGIVFVDQYIKLVRNTPEQFPYEIVITLVMTALIMYSPYRTWLKPADIIFVMPQQVKMKKYFNYCRQRGYVLSLIPLIIGSILVHFLLNAYTDDYSTIILIQFITMKIIVYYSLYNINELPHRGIIFVLKLLTLCSVLIALYSGLSHYRLGPSVLVAILVLFVISFYVQLRTSHFVNWQQMIEEEQKKVHRTYRFLNLFVDVPKIQNATKKRQYLAQFASLIAFARKNTFAYLHYLTFARSEVGGIYVRNIVVGALLASVTSSTMLWNGYASLMFAIMFIGINAVQLTTLRQIHRHSVWQNIYPIPLEAQQKQMTMMELRLLIVSSLFIILVPIISIALAGNWSLLSQFLIAAVVIVLWRLIVIRNIVKKQLS